MKVPKKTRRVRVTVLVSPSTYEWLTKTKNDSQASYGEVIDYLVTSCTQKTD